MVEPVSLTVGAVVTALVVKASERAGDEVVGAGASVLGRVVEWLRGRFRDAGDSAAGSALEQVVEVPDSPSRVSFLAGMLDARAEADRQFRVELERLITAAERDGVTVKSIGQTAHGNQNVQVADVQSGSVTISYGGGTPPPARS